MSEQEAIDFLANYAFVAFPSVRDWVAGTEKPNETVRMWAKALAKCERSECEAVIDSWIDGTAEVPKYMRDGIALYVRDAVMKKRGEKMRAKPLEEQRKHLSKGQSIMEGVRTSEVYINHWEPLRIAVVAREIEHESARRQWLAIIDEEFAKQAKGRSWNG